MTDRYHLGDYSQLVANAAAKLDFENVAARLRAHDHTLWSDETAEISDRLAWLTLPTDIRPELTELSEFAHAVRSAGYQHVVLLGHGRQQSWSGGNPPSDRVWLSRRDKPADAHA